MRIGNTTLIPQNVVPYGTRVVICDNEGNEVGNVNLGRLKMPQVGTKRYSVGILSDTHTEVAKSNYDAERVSQVEDSQVDLARAISYFSGVAQITCVCGDLVSYNDHTCNTGEHNGKTATTVHKEIVDANKGSMEVFEIAGNHEHYSGAGAVSIVGDDYMTQATGYPLRYVEERNGDVFIMCGACGWYTVFDKASIQWLYETLEANRNKRCFLFLHSFLEGKDYCGDYKALCTWSMVNNSYKTAFANLLKHYKNVVYFHGHAHKMLQMQDYLQGLSIPFPANYDHALGIHSVHIPSLAYPRDITSGVKSDENNRYGESQGYLMDVYDNHVVLNGLDFANGTTDDNGVYKPAIIPIATYCLDTTLQTVEDGTFVDSTGLIKT